MGARAIVRLQQGKYKEAEADLDQSIHLSAKNAGNYINRALARFHQNNLRGAMSDYDLALDIDPNNFSGTTTAVCCVPRWAMTTGQ